jgi:hypothetical protein
MNLRLLLVILILSPIIGYATHMRGGQIRVVSSNGLKVFIEMRLFTYTGSPIKAGDGIFDFGDGTTEMTPTKESTVLPGQSDTGIAIYTMEHTYAAAGTYRLSYMEPNLNGGILNMFNAVETRFYVESSFVLTPGTSVSSPDFPTEPIMLCQVGREYSFSTAAIDDSTSNEFYYKYQLVAPKKERNAPVGNYVFPDSIKVNRDNGLITWNTKFKRAYVQGLYLISVRVEKYNKSDLFLGYVERLVQIIVEDNETEFKLTSTVNDSSKRVVVTDGQQKKIKVLLTDKNGMKNLSFDLHFNKIIKDNISFTQYDSTGAGGKYRVGVVTLKTTAGMVNDLPYPITLRGHASYLTDVTFLYMTKSIDLPGYEPGGPDQVVGLPDEPELTVYPNPFNSEVFVDGTSATEVTFLNAAGQVVMKTPLRHGQPLNTSSLPSGFYLLRITDKNGVNTHMKLVRQ